MFLVLACKSNCDGLSNADVLLHRFSCKVQVSDERILAYFAAPKGNAAESVNMEVMFPTCKPSR